MATEITVPVLGESVTEGSIGKWLKQPSDAVAADEFIVLVETDKVATEVPSPVAGVLVEQRVQVGDTVEIGAVLAVIEEGATATGAAPAAAKAGTPAPAASDAPVSDAAQTLSPAVRRAVLEHGVDPSTIKGTGKDGRLTKEDVLAAAKAKTDPAPAPASAPGFLITSFRFD